ncbi:unnamed protein product [Trichobilharzia regenti]|nr:unnamed protein product [Trichobilharzia regenti]
MSLLDDALMFTEDLKEVPKDKIEENLFKSLLKCDNFQTLKNWIFTQKPIILSQLKQKWAEQHYLNNSCDCDYLKKAQRRFYKALNLQSPQIGVDDILSSSFLLSREHEAEEIINLDSSERAQKFLQCGCPLGYRAKLWEICLNARVKNEDRIHYDRLKSFVAEDEYMTDQLICKEVQLTASNDDMHFVFCDYTYQVCCNN